MVRNLNDALCMEGMEFWTLILWVLVPSPECLRRDVAGWRISGYVRVIELNNIKTGANQHVILSLHYNSNTIGVHLRLTAKLLLKTVADARVGPAGMQHGLRGRSGSEKRVFRTSSGLGGRLQGQVSQREGSRENSDAVV